MRKRYLGYLLVCSIVLLFIPSCVSLPEEISPTPEFLTPTSEFLTSTPTSQAPTIEDEDIKTITPEPEIQKEMPYGVVYPFSAGPWKENDRILIRTHLEYLKSLGINTVVQVFNSRALGTGNEENWLIYLDEADSIGIQVIAYLHPGGKWTEDGFDYASIEGFLNVVDGHPALLAYLGLHEPLENYTSKQLREFYTEVKEMSPNLPIAHYMGYIAWFDWNLRFPGRKFTAGICDICISWYYPASQKTGTPILEENELRNRIQENLSLVKERSPDSQLWFHGQTYTQDAHKRKLRMPTPEEMETIFLISLQEGVDGFLWYPWHHNTYDQVLSDEEMSPQREAVQKIYEEYVANP